MQMTLRYKFLVDNCDVFFITEDNYYFRIAKKSGIIFLAYKKYFFVRHSSGYKRSDNSQTPNRT